MNTKKVFWWHQIIPHEIHTFRSRPLHCSYCQSRLSVSQAKRHIVQNMNSKVYMRSVINNITQFLFCNQIIMLDESEPWTKRTKRRQQYSWRCEGTKEDDEKEWASGFCYVKAIKHRKAEIREKNFETRRKGKK